MSTIVSKLVDTPGPATHDSPMPWADQNFRDNFAVDLRSALRREGLSVKRAAKVFGISRQGLHNYLSGKRTPRGEVMSRLVAFLDLPLRKGDHLFTAASFPPPTSPSDVRPRLPQQIPINFEKLEGRRFDVGVSTSEDRYVFEITLKK
jgi:transcriptional regulator with XRE-family HTH domain